MKFNVESFSIEEILDKFYSQDFEDPNFDSKGLSLMDKLWFSKVETSIIKTEDSCHQIDLPSNVKGNIISSRRICQIMI